MLAYLADRLTEFLAGLGHDVIVTGYQSLGGGRSVLTAGLELQSDDRSLPDQVVLQVQKDAGPLAGIASPQRQFDLLKLAQSHGLPVANPWWCSDDPVHLGAPFLVTSTVLGASLDPFRRDHRGTLRELADNSFLKSAIVDHLVTLHSIEIAKLPESAQLSNDNFPVRHEIDRWSVVIAKSRFVDDPLLAHVEQWLRDHEPAEQRCSLIHGDYRMGNFIVAEGGRVAAILDWEFASAGDPLLDVGLMASPAVLAGGLYDGIWEDGEFADLYATRTGVELSTDILHYYVVLATFKVAGLWVNATISSSDESMSLEVLRSGFSVLTLRRLLADALHLVPQRPHEITPSVRAAVRALAPSGTDPWEDRRSVLLSGVARAMLERPSPECERDFWTQYLDWMGTQEPILAREPAVSDLAHAAKRLAGSGDEEALQLLAQAAQLPFGMWP
ncbi:phosphotransferase family protein [Nocardioides sp. CN2-186]|uniref:phosphotransferase family protein n=1 Tax=Nocardioides tweenelious TaxID=3156607 RepID=UPI0032B592E1